MELRGPPQGTERLSGMTEAAGLPTCPGVSPNPTEPWPR